MNVIISSAILAIAILMVAHSIAELKPKRRTETVKAVSETRRLRARVPADWNRIMEETKIEKGGKRK